MKSALNHYVDSKFQPLANKQIPQIVLSESPHHTALITGWLDSCFFWRPHNQLAKFGGVSWSTPQVEPRTERIPSWPGFPTGASRAPQGSVNCNGPWRQNSDGLVVRVFSQGRYMYPPGNERIPPWEKENHLQKGLGRGYVSFQEGTDLDTKIAQATESYFLLHGKFCLVIWWSIVLLNLRATLPLSCLLVCFTIYTNPTSRTQILVRISIRPASSHWLCFFWRQAIAHPKV